MADPLVRDERDRMSKVLGYTICGEPDGTERSDG
ncbi:MAG: hypothetical protein JWM05_2884, partial [Acidimicrobiales bacterium]|nr:hypothetical protein [Acidimicrobiales bacterium]